VSHKRTITAMAVCLASLAAGCGEEDGNPIPASYREQLESRLTEAENRLENGSEGACSDILDDTEPAVSGVLASLPNNVDADTRQRLDDGFDRLWELVTRECEQLQQEQTETETTPEPPPPPPPETDTETTPTTPEPPPEEDDEGDGGQGNGNSGGNGGGQGGGQGDGGGQGGVPGGVPGGVDIPGAGGGGTVAPGEG
jgi:hypothetical protein